MDFSEKVIQVQIYLKVFFSLIFAVLLPIAAWCSISLGDLNPVPLTLQACLVMLAGLCLGPQFGSAAVLLYLLAGYLGLPVFTNGQSGLSAFLGPSGGYLLGFIPCVISCGLIGISKDNNFKTLFMRCLNAHMIMLILGATLMMSQMSLDFHTALVQGFTVFIPSMLLQCALAAGIYKYLVEKGVLKNKRCAQWIAQKFWGANQKK